MSASESDPENMSTGKRTLMSIRDVLQKHGRRICPSTPIPVTERFVKEEQPWPANEEKKSTQGAGHKQRQSNESKRAQVSKGFPSHKFDFAVSKQGTFNNESFIPVKLVKREKLNKDVRKYTFKHDQPEGVCVHTGQHFLCGFMLEDGITARPYAMTRPIGQDKEDGTFDMIVKTYFPDEKQPGGLVSNILDMLDAERSDTMLIMGSYGPIRYQGEGSFLIDQEEDGNETTIKAKRVNFISGGTGMTPVWATIKQMLECDKQIIPVRFLDANTDEEEILLHDEIDALARDHKEAFQVIHTLENAGDGWQGETGLADKDKIDKHLFAPGEGTVTFVCGPPPMLKAAGEALEEVGFKAGKDFFHF